MTNRTNLRALLTAALVLTTLAAGAHGDGHKPVTPTQAVAEATEDVHIMAAPEEMAWAPGPGSLPPGAEFVLIEGDPAAGGPLTLRLKFPAGYRIPAHSHPAIEHITVISGVFHAGAGDKLNTSQGRGMPTGSFLVMPVGHNYFAWTEEET